MKSRLALIAVSVTWAAPALAHHSHAMFNDQSTVEISGTVKEFQYTNPHSWLLLDVKGADGSSTTWGFEAEGPSTLLRAGIKKSDFAPGTEMTVWGHPMRDGRPAAEWIRAVRHSDEKEFRSRPLEGN